MPLFPYDLRAMEERQGEVFIRAATSAVLMPVQIMISFLLGSGLMMLLLLLGLALSPLIGLFFGARWAIRKALSGPTHD
jgi:cytosine/uracil/thiamine/allantoin permease